MAVLAVAACSTLKDGEYNLSVVATGDGHGYWFAKPIEDGGRARGSLMSQSGFVEGVRAAKGEDNVILVDAGDNFSGIDERLSDLNGLLQKVLTAIVEHGDVYIDIDALSKMVTRSQKNRILRYGGA